MTNSPDSPATAPVGARIGSNVRRLRLEEGLELRKLSDQLAEVGHPISLGQLSKLELGQRRVDVDDLVALAMVLNVTPSRLLLPKPTEDEGEVVSLTPHVSVPWRRAWQWMSGDWWLPEQREPADHDDEYDWYEASRPHDPTGVYNFNPASLRGHEKAMAKVVGAVQQAIADGMSRRQVVSALDFYLAVSPEYGVPLKEMPRG